MELIYVWINKSRNSFIQETEVNFSNSINFHCEKEKNEIILTCSDIENKNFNIVQSDVIKNIKVIVGENGSGKTTLLQHLFDRDFFAMSEKREMDQYEYAQSVLVFEISGEYRIFYNFEHFKNHTSYHAHKYSEVERIELPEIMNAIESDTTVYLSNSAFDSKTSTYSSHGFLKQLKLTPNTIGSLNRKFYMNMTPISKGFYKKASYFEFFQRNIQEYDSTESADSFQSICDIMFYGKLIDQENYERYLGKKCNLIRFDFRSYTESKIFKEALEENLKNIDVGITADDDRNDMDDMFKEYCRKEQIFKQRFDNSSFKTLKYWTKSLLLNLFFELNFCAEWKLPKDILDSGPLDQILKDVKGYLNRASISDKIRSYYINAIEEIEELDRFDLNPDILAEDHFYIEQYSVRYESNHSNFYKFCNFIEKMAKNKQTFVLKYITIRKINMSSGERAFQNFMSWISLIPFFSETIDSSIKGTRKDILLLIDEIDLYLHPEWQRNIISILLKELEKQFQGSKIQLIFTTHSPIILSDMQLENTIYLKGKSKFLQDFEEHKQTFGSNIHTLFRDAFYLNRTIGEFAYKTVGSTFKDLDNFEKDSKNRTLKNKCEKSIDLINQIGDPLIKKKMLEKYYTCFPSRKETDRNKEKNELVKELNEFAENHTIAIEELEPIFEKINELK